MACTPPYADRDVPTDTVPADSDTTPIADDSDETDDGADTDPLPLPPVVLEGGFVDLSAALWAAGPWWVDQGSVSPFREINYTHGSFVDLDGDGMPELVLQGLRPAPERYPEAMVLRYVGGELVVAPELAGQVAEPGHSLSAMIDFDEDGALDVVVSGPHGTVEFGPVSREWPDWAGAPGFVDSGLADLDRDGWLDVLDSNIPCQTGTATWTPRVRTGLRRFTARPELVSTPGAEIGRLFSVGWLPVGDLVVAPGMACQGVVARPVAYRRVDVEGTVSWVAVEPTASDAAYRGETGGQALTAMHPTSATALDLDGDGDMDLAIGSWVSRVQLWRDDGGDTFHDASVELAVPVLPREGVGPTTDRMIPWGMTALDVDRDGFDDLVINHGDDVGAWADQIPGTQRTVLWLRRGDGWQEGRAGLPEVFEGRSLTVGDLDRDGRPDLVLGGIGEQPRVLLNRVEGPPGVALRLVGTTSNRQGLGALVRPVEGGQVGPARAVGHMVGPGPQSEPLVFLAAGPDGDLDAVDIVWPSGLAQRVGPLEGGRVHEVVEPSTWSVEPASRQVPADAVSTARVRVTPRRADGGIDPAASVAVRVVGGSGALVGGPVWTNDGWVQEVRAPAAPGELVLEVTVDGVPSRLRPRIWWD